jgi:predicted GIY-YIG superfamily endonuclease
MADGTSTITAPDDPLVGKHTGSESSLSSWVGPYVTEMLGRGQALASQPYQAYMGPLSAGQSAAQQSAFSGIAGLAVPTQQMGAFAPQSFTQQGVAQQYMSPYIQAAMEPQIAEAQRQAQIQRLQDASRLTRAGAYGGSRQAIMESELNRNMLRNMADITGTGYQQAFTQGREQFNTEQGRQQAAQNELNQYGLQALQRQAELGAQERAITSEGMMTDRAQFEEERDFPYKQTQYMQSLLQGLPLAAQSYTYAEPSALSNILSGAGGLQSLYEAIFGGGGEYRKYRSKSTRLYDRRHQRMIGGIDQQIQQRVDAYRDNPQQLMQRYQQNQELIDLLAMQKLKSEKDAAAREIQMQMQTTPQTIKQQREAELLGRTKDEMVQQTSGIMQERQKRQQQNMQRTANQGLPQLPAGNMQRMAGGGIVAFARGGLNDVDARLRQLIEAALELGESPEALAERLRDNPNALAILRSMQSQQVDRHKPVWANAQKKRLAYQNLVLVRCQLL